MRIGELAKRSGISRDTLRFYERQGLIRSQPGPDSSNSYRHYPDETVASLEQIADAQAAGMTIADLTLFLGQLEAADSDDFDGVAFLQERIAEVETRIRRSRRFLATLRAAKTALAQPG